MTQQRGEASPHDSPRTLVVGVYCCPAGPLPPVGRNPLICGPSYEPALTATATAAAGLRGAAVSTEN